MTRPTFNALPSQRFMAHMRLFPSIALLWLVFSPMAALAQQGLAADEVEPTAQIFYKKFAVDKQQQKYESAARYIELRASIDTTNVTWQLDAGSYLEEYLFQGSISEPVYGRIMGYYTRALAAAVKRYGKINPIVGTCYSHLGDMTDVYLDPREDSLENYGKALEIMALNFGKNSVEVAECLRKMGKVYSEQFNFITRFNPCADKAEACAQKAYDIYLKQYGEKHPLTALACAELGNSKYFYDDSFPYYEKALRILESLGDGHEVEKAKVLAHIAHHCHFGVEGGRSADVQSEMLFSEGLMEKQTDEKGNFTFRDFSKKDFEDFKLWQDTRIENAQRHIEGYRQSISYYERALAIAEPLYGEQYPWICSIHKTLETLKEDIGWEESEMEEANNNLSNGRKYQNQGRPGK